MLIDVEGPASGASLKENVGIAGVMDSGSSKEIVGMTGEVGAGSATGSTIDIDGGPLAALRLNLRNLSATESSIEARVGWTGFGMALFGGICGAI